MDGSRTFRYLVHLGLLSVLLLALAACAPQPTPTQPPTATPAPATATPTTPATPTEQPVELTPTQIPATSEATQQATQETTPQTTSEAEQDAAGTKEAQLQQDIQALQEAFRQLAERYPNGYTESLPLRGRMALRGGLEGLGWATFYNLQELIRIFDRDLEIALTKFLKEHPDTFLIVHFESERAVWCKQKYNDPSCRFTDRSVDVTVVIGYFYGKLTVRDVFTTDAYTKQVASRAADWASPSAILGSHPTSKDNAQPTDWDVNVGVAYFSNTSKRWEIVPLTGIQGKDVKLEDVVFDPATRKKKPITSGTIYFQEPSKEDFAGISEQLAQRLQQLASKE